MRWQIANFLKAWDEAIGIDWNFDEFMIHHAPVPMQDIKFFPSLMMRYLSWSIWSYGTLQLIWWKSSRQSTLEKLEFSTLITWFLVPTTSISKQKKPSVITTQWWAASNYIFFTMLLFVVFIYSIISFFSLPCAYSLRWRGALRWSGAPDSRQQAL